MKTMCVGRLLQRLEQRVEGRVGDLVRFVEDVNLEAVARRPVTGSVAQLANFVDAAVGGGVNLDHVHGIAGANLGAGVADPAWLGCGPLGGADSVRQLSAMARMRAMVVFPMPRCPEKM